MSNVYHMLSIDNLDGKRLGTKMGIADASLADWRSESYVVEQWLVPWGSYEK